MIVQLTQNVFLKVVSAGESDVVTWFIDEGIDVNGQDDVSFLSDCLLVMTSICLNRMEHLPCFMLIVYT